MHAIQTDSWAQVELDVLLFFLISFIEAKLTETILGFDSKSKRPRGRPSDARIAARVLTIATALRFRYFWANHE